MGQHCGKWLHILKINFHLAIRKPLLTAILYLLLIPFLRGISNLDAERSAECLKQSVVFIGIILAVPLHVPEQSGAIRDVVCSRKIPGWRILTLRFGMAAVLLLTLTGIFAGIMVVENCRFPYARLVLETMGREMILGSAGLFTAVLSDSAAVGYLMAFAGALISV